MILVAFVVIVFHSISVLVYRGHSRHIRENSLNHAPIVQIGKEWEEVYEPGDHTHLTKNAIIIRLNSIKTQPYYLSPTSPPEI